jgi:hypothetical protein
MLRSRALGFAFSVAFILGFAEAAQATSFTLGTIAGPGTYNFGNSKDLGPFTDRVYFTIAPGVSLIFSGEALHSTWRHGGIYDLDGTLTEASGIIAEADAVFTNFHPYPDVLVTWQSIVLGPGNYHLDIFGNSESDVGPDPNDYSGQIQFAATPLPASLLLMLTALGGMGVLGPFRIRKSA